MLPPIVLRMIPRLGSPFDHEVTATARAIERILKSQKLDWHDVVAAVNGQPQKLKSNGHESLSAVEMRCWLEAISCEPWPNEWTREFIESVLSRESLNRLSQKQIDCVNKIIAQAKRRGVRV